MLGLWTHCLGEDEYVCSNNHILSKVASFLNSRLRLSYIYCFGARVLRIIYSHEMEVKERLLESASSP